MLHCVGPAARPVNKARDQSAQNSALALEITLSRVMPNFSYSRGAGAEAPKVSMPMKAPSVPMYLCCGGGGKGGGGGEERVSSVG